MHAVSEKFLTNWFMHVEKRGGRRTLDFYSVAHNMLSTMETFLIGLELPSSFYWFFLGVLVGVALDFLWRKTGISKYEKRIEVFEHYHWGILLLFLMRILLKLNEAFFSLAGAGIVFILAELTQEHPFALKSDHQVSSTIIGTILSIFMFLI